jgi:hypothetical protein
MADTAFRAFRVAIAVAAALGLIFTFQGTMKGEGAAAFLGHLGKFITYFTVLSNAAVGAWCVLAAVKGGSPGGPLPRFALLCCISVTGIVYAAFLRGLWNPQGVHLAGDALLHYAVPIAFLLDWLFSAPKGSLRGRHAFLPAAVSGAYLAYVAALSPWFGAPYPFLDVAKLGLTGVGAWVAALLAGSIALALGFVGLDAALARRGA